MSDRIHCHICGNDIDARLRFCGNCGTELRLAQPGLLLRSALAWRGHLGKLGWWETPDSRFRTWIGGLIEAARLPAYDSQLEPWIMFSNGAFENWKLCALRPGDDQGRSVWQPETAVLATRCRFVTLDLSAQAIRAIWYKDLRAADRERYKDMAVIEFADDHGTQLRIGMPFDGTRFLDVAGSLPPERLTPAHPDPNAWEAVQGRLDFHEIVALFLTDIARVTDPRP